VAPSLIPRKPGDRIKTDRRDAISLAKRIGRAKWRRSGFRIQLMRRSAISCAPVWRRSAVCAGPVSNCPPFCCAMAMTTIDPHGR